MKKSKIIWDNKSLPFILEALGMKIDYEGIIRNIKTDSFIRDVDDNIVKAQDLIGIIGQNFITRESQLLSLWS